MNSQETKTDSIELNAGTIVGFLFPTIDYTEESEDRRKKPVLYWRSYQAYPFVQLPNEDDSYDEEIDDSTEIAIMAEGGSNDNRNYVQMTYGAFLTFLRANTSFRMLTADDVFDVLNLM
ncbi:hypothetical protein [Limosilactobacillus reuteri]|uniref:Uncharacterized protein n=1 Tax=Limosilactobacillus reuteri TaxID=1598 RepID=A0ABD6Y656_LIMRT|nr:hypothetical protein [Limosilactobacillus reuteri]PWT37226.1 hypothetical protein DKZ35_06255 [Limosilactobacillus reuteri]